MEQKPKLGIYDSGFTPYVKSASLREENKDVKPTYFEWAEYFPNRPPDPKFYTDGDIGNITMNEIAWLIEPRCLKPENYEIAENPNHQIYMKAILTYDKQLLDSTDKTLFYPLGGSSIAFDKWGMYPKTKDICMILSDKKTTEGHKSRHQIYEKYKDSGLIDFFGAGAGKPFESKFEVLKDYRYCIVVESCQIEYYWTEKLIDCFSVGTIPIYYGCLSIGEWFDVYGMQRFYKINHLQDIIDNFKNWNMHKEHEEHIQNNIEKAKKYRICEDQIAEMHPGLFQ